MAVINGTGGDDNLVGTGVADTLNGFAGNDTLNGGAGNDTMVGGQGNDVYIVAQAGDVVTELAGEGTDTIQSSVTYTASNNVENLTLTGAGNINATGNTLNNILTGNTGNNILNGGTGTDTMTGGTGNDTYVVDNVGDVVTESAGEGTDIIQSSVSYTIATNVETLTLTGTTNINATGNAANNTLNGNTGNNIIDGGAGNDTMAGGTGNDTYIVDSATDVVTEAAGAGTDTIQTSVTFTMSNNVENMILTGGAAINATGNTLANTITGNGADNTISGGTGADTMIGGAGNDTYVVDNVGDVVTENAGEGTDLVQTSVTYTISANV
ncbi:MAG TPA: calcium-binding protein, partial [Alphaproteobacteria bacterium]